MLRHLLMASACACALAGTALAADLPVQAPPPPPPPPPIWDGFYVGLNAGASFGGNSAVTTTDYPAFAASTWEAEGSLSTMLANTTLGNNKTGFIGGGQIGYNYTPSANWLLGLEADFQGVAGAHSTASTGGAGIPLAFSDETIVSASTATKSLGYLGTARGRIGYEFMPTMLVYATGGLAYGGVKSSSDIWQNNLFDGAPDNSGFASSGSYSSCAPAGWSAAASNGCSCQTGASRRNICITISAGRRTGWAGLRLATRTCCTRPRRPRRRASTATSRASASTIISTSPRRRLSSPNTEIPIRPFESDNRGSADCSPGLFAALACARASPWRIIRECLHRPAR